MHNWSIQNSCDDFCQLCTKTDPEFLNKTICILSVHSHCLLNKPSSLWVKLLVAMSFVSLIHGRQNIKNKNLYFTYQNRGLTIQKEEEPFIRLTLSQTRLILSSGDCLPTLICFARCRQAINVFVYRCPSIILHSYSTQNQQRPYQHFKVIFQKESWHCKSRQWILRTTIGITNQYESLETIEEKTNPCLQGDRCRLLVFSCYPHQGLGHLGTSADACKRLSNNSWPLKSLLVHQDFPGTSWQTWILSTIEYD